jgi:tetratricopeptide repeat protein 8
VGKCQFKLGMIKDSEKQFISSLKDQNMIGTQIELAKVAIRLDQPVRAIQLYDEGLRKHSFESSLEVGIARIHEQLNDSRKSFLLYKNILILQNNNVEAIASIASYHFYTDQPEVALRFYKRLVQCGVNSPELWNNMGLCCYYAS